ncbi:MAG TPA: lipase maturation factor family protein [Tepidisphaeraceae bacterium]|nr:lipase maturation factor family protein [Tepidisphaeraceae bacterium]
MAEPQDEKRSDAAAAPSPAPSPRKPLLIWDGDCAFCRRWITRWQHRTRGRVDYEPYQRAAERVPQVPREEFGKAVHLLEPDGTVARGADAVFRSLAHGGHAGGRAMLWLHRRAAPFRWVSEAAYAFVARHRNGIDKLDTRFVGLETRPPRHRLTRSVFLRLLGLIYLLAFYSLFVQVEGLVGTSGILPANRFAGAAAHFYGPVARWWHAPTLVYLNPSDAMLRGLCVAGLAASCLLIVGALPLLMTIIAWTCYLSLVVAGQAFLAYQWDALLLEAGFLAIFWSPPRWLDARTNPPPSRDMLLLFRWLLFRVMFASAVVKLGSGDPSWRDWSALRYHFETQPLPTWTSWYAHHAPPWLLAAACLLTLAIEALVPFLYFAPRRTRLFAFWVTVLFQLAILATGNYGFFNLLTIVLAISLLDDWAVARVVQWEPEVTSTDAARHRRPWARRWIVHTVAAVLFLLSMMGLAEQLLAVRWPRPLAALQAAARPFHLANDYGLFAWMTKERPEILIEGSDDGATWKPYAFRFKPGDPRRPPRFAAPHLPRLDWQLWFEAMNPSPEPWFGSLLVRLLEGKPQVLDLLAPGGNPFPSAPPKYIRATIWDYRFTDRATRRATGTWWVARPQRVFVPAASVGKIEPRSHEGTKARRIPLQFQSDRSCEMTVGRGIEKKRFVPSCLRAFVPSWSNILRSRRALARTGAEGLGDVALRAPGGGGAGLAGVVGLEQFEVPGQRLQQHAASVGHRPLLRLNQPVGPRGFQPPAPAYPFSRPAAGLTFSGNHHSGRARRPRPLAGGGCIPSFGKTRDTPGSYARPRDAHGLPPMPPFPPRLNRPFAPLSSPPARSLCVPRHDSATRTIAELQPTK